MAEPQLAIVPMESAPAINVIQWIASVRAETVELFERHLQRLEGQRTLTGSDRALWDDTKPILDRIEGRLP
ncbi:MAG TPA: hypothetical protein VFT22_27695 [Kofleriaceae bacterium]|nr:hypothetical protein [Kofleriaceae bacterium]